MSDNENDPTTGVREVLPEPVKAAPRRGGTHFHKPGCQCKPCKARARDAEAKLVTAGGGEQALAPLDPRDEIVRADELIAPGAKRTSRYKKTVIAEWIKARTLEPDITNVEIARRLSITPHHLQFVIRQATQEGWLVHDDPISRIDYQIIPKAIDNLNHFLEAKDRVVTIEVAKGTIFKSYQEAKGIGQSSQTVLALKIELPTNDSAQLEVVEGQILGKPKILLPGVPES